MMSVLGTTKHSSCGVLTLGNKVILYYNHYDKPKKINFMKVIIIVKVNSPNLSVVILRMLTSTVTL